jgi:flagellar basal-body rod modification protein FlgD
MVNATSLSLGGLAGDIPSNTVGASKSLGETYDNFLLMLTTQLKNQDPLNPMESKEFTSQLIQMSTAEQAIAQTARIEDMMKLMQASTINTALNYIGLSVDYLGDTFGYNGKTPSEMSYVLPEASANTQISVLNAEGNVVFSTEGSKAAGVHKFIWDGKDNGGNPQKPGYYTIKVGAQTADNKVIKTATVVPGTVQGVETDKGQVFLVIDGQPVTIDEVKSAYAMSFYKPPASEDGSGTPDPEANPDSEDA